MRTLFFTIISLLSVCISAKDGKKNLAGKYDGKSLAQFTKNIISPRSDIIFEVRNEAQQIHNAQNWTAHCDTIKIDDSTYQYIRRQGDIEQTVNYYGLTSIKGITPFWDARSCSGSTHVKGGYDLNSYVDACEVNISEPYAHKFSYGSQQFTYWIGEPDISRSIPTNVYATMTRHYYVFAEGVASPYIFSIFGNPIDEIHVGDIDNDGCIDILIIDNFPTKEDAEKLRKKDKEILLSKSEDRFNYFKVTFATYKDNKWQTKESNGKELCILFKIDEALEPLNSSKVRILYSNWFS